MAAWLSACSSLAPGAALAGEGLQPAQSMEVAGEIGVAELGPGTVSNSGISVLSGGWDRQASTFVIQAHDATSGQPAEWGALPLKDGGRELSTYAFSPDGNGLALVTGTTPFCTAMGGGSACWPSSKALHFVDLTTRSTISVDPGVGRVGALTFSPDGRHVALVHESRQAIEARLYRASDGQLLGSTKIPFVPSYLGYTVGGRGLILVGAEEGGDPGSAPPGPLTVMLLDGESLGTTWQQTIDGIVHGSWCLEACDGSHEFTLTAVWSPAIVRIPGTDRVAIVHADADRLTSIDAAEQRVTTTDITTPRSWLDQLMALGTVAAEAKGASEGAYREAVASPDGSRLYTVGRAYHARRGDDGTWQMWDEPMGLQVINPLTGSRIASIDSEASRVALTKDGAWLLLTVWGDVEVSTQVLPVDGLEEGRALEAWELMAARSLEGTPVVMGLSWTSSLLRLSSFDPITLNGGESWVLPGGSTLLLP
jgi:WD40 repeat protein